MDFAETHDEHVRRRRSEEAEDPLEISFTIFGRKLVLHLHPDSIPVCELQLLQHDTFLAAGSSGKRVGVYY